LESPLIVDNTAALPPEEKRLILPTIV